MLDDPNKALAKMRVVNAERRVLRAVEDLEKQVAQYELEQALNAYERLRGGDLREEAVRLAAGQGWVRGAAFLCVMTAVADRLFWKYTSDDSYRLFFLDAGHLAQTFALLAAARGLGAFTTASMKESRIEQLLCLDGVREFPVYLCGAGMARRGRHDSHTLPRTATGVRARTS